jgi:hypothetical protein
MLISSTVIVDSNKNIAFCLAFFGFFIAGLGSSALAQSSSQLPAGYQMVKMQLL